MSIVGLFVTARVLGPDGRGLFVATVLGAFGSLSRGQVAMHVGSGRRRDQWLPDVAGSIGLTLAAVVSITWIGVAVMCVTTGGAFFRHLSPGVLALAASLLTVPSSATFSVPHLRRPAGAFLLSLRIREGPWPLRGTGGPGAPSRDTRRTGPGCAATRARYGPSLLYPDAAQVVEEERTREPGSSRAGAASPTRLGPTLQQGKRPRNLAGTPNVSLYRDICNFPGHRWSVSRIFQVAQATGHRE